MEIGPQTSVALARTFFPENIGSAARACAVMGFPNLALIAPHALPNDERAITLASHAAHTVLKNSKIFDDMSSWASLCDLRIGFCLRDRAIGPVALNLKDLPALLKEKKFSKLGLLFGCEKSGLDNQELSYCHYVCEIETSDLLNYHSLNLSQAVQIATYTLRTAFLEDGFYESLPKDDAPQAHALKAFDALLEHIVSSPKMRAFSQRTTPEQTLKRMRLIIQQSLGSQKDLDFLFGLLRCLSHD